MLADGSPVPSATSDDGVGNGGDDGGGNGSGDGGGDNDNGSGGGRPALHSVIGPVLGVLLVPSKSEFSDLAL